MRGLKTLILEKEDFAAVLPHVDALDHGGFRYLQHFEFGLVREDMREREILPPHRAASGASAAVFDTTDQAF